MSKAFGLTLVAPILFLACNFLISLTNIQQEDTALASYVLAAAVDYATDAAAEEMLSSTHLGQDYSDQGRTFVDPDTALDTFLTLMCVSYDLPLTEKALDSIEAEYIPVFCVAAYDGYYLYTPRIGNDGGAYLQGTLKLPYRYTTSSAHYALTLGEEYAYKLTAGELSKVTTASQGITEDLVSQVVNSQVGDAFTYAYQQVTGRTGRFVSLPAGLVSFSDVNPIKGTTVLAIIEGWDYGHAGKLAAYSVGGSRIEESRPVAGYVQINADGTTTKYYAYADLVPPSISVANTYSTPEEAAQAGYYCDPEYMM